MKEVLLIGTGPMSYDYFKILKSLEFNPVVVGRGHENSQKFRDEFNCKVVEGGVESFLGSTEKNFDSAIVAVGINLLFDVTKSLVKAGVKNILVEKPGALEISEFEELSNLSTEMNSNIIIAYNRRFYASVIEAKKLIEEDGGVTSFNFEFTEWSHILERLEKPKVVKEKWLLGNSTHVIDLAFYLGGKPKEMSSFSKGGLEWHPSSSIFSGAGITEKSSLFSYKANWESAGRWSVEVLTSKRKYIFEPVEKLQVQNRGTINKDFHEINYTLDEEYKPGLYIQTKKFIEENFSDMCSLGEQLEMMKTYEKIGNY